MEEDRPGPPCCSLSPGRGEVGMRRVYLGSSLSIWLVTGSMVLGILVSQTLGLSSLKHIVAGQYV